jgi:hypothetical protein
MHTSDRQGQIMALAVRPFSGVPSSLGSDNGDKLSQSRSFPKKKVAIPALVEREQHQSFGGLLPEKQGRNLVLTVLYVPYSLDIGG